MHYLIKLIVEAENAEDALIEADSDAETLVEWQDFDWYDMKGRWGDSKAYKVTSKKGAELLKEGMQSTRGEFDSAVKTVRYMLDNFSEEEIYNEQFPKWDEMTLPQDVFLSRWQFARAGGRGNSIYVYAVNGDLWGGKVENDKSLESILSDKTKKLWVVPVDFHN